MKRRDLLPLLAAPPFLPAAVVRAQQATPAATWTPDRPIRFVVGFPHRGCPTEIRLEPQHSG